MKYVIARQSVPGNIGSREFEIPPYLVHRRLTDLTLFPAPLTSANPRRLASVRYQGVPTVGTDIPPPLAKEKEVRINPHSVELGRRFSPIRF
jgi:hypothetical protein